MKYQWFSSFSTNPGVFWFDPFPCPLFNLYKYSYGFALKSPTLLCKQYSIHPSLQDNQSQGYYYYEKYKFFFRFLFSTSNFTNPINFNTWSDPTLNILKIYYKLSFFLGCKGFKSFLILIIKKNKNIYIHLQVFQLV